MATIALAIVRALAMAKAVKEKTFPIVKLYACKECSSLASVSLDTDTNTIKVQKCRCA